MKSTQSFIRTGRLLFTSLIAALWVGFLALLALIPSFPDIPVIPDAYLGQVGHYATHFVMAGLIYFLMLILNPAQTSRRQYVFIAFAFSLFIGVALEAVQITLESRSAAFFDIIYNSAGSLTGGLSSMSIHALMSRNPRWPS